MKRLRYLIPSLFAAGFTGQSHLDAAAPQLTSGGAKDTDRPTLFEMFKQGHAVTLAQHRSHRSHSSHRSGSSTHYSHSSHTSHRSSTGGTGSGYTAPVYTSPAPTPTPAPAPAPARFYVPTRSAEPGEASAPRSDNLPALSGRTERFKAIAKRVQIALLAQGYYEGAIDGDIGPGTRSAIRRFQTARGIAVTGTITSEVLDGLRISSE
jgi:His-Xaa-Ser repeat protein HxsA